MKNKNNIKILRIEKGLLQKELAEKVHVTQTAVSQWENGSKRPEEETANALADFFGVSVEYLLGEMDENHLYYANNIQDSNFVQGNGSITVGESDTTSKEEAELLRIYRVLDVRGRAKLLNAAFALEDENKEG